MKFIDDNLKDSFNVSTQSRYFSHPSILKVYHELLRFIGIEVYKTGTRGSLRWLKKSLKEVLSREGKCIRFRDGSTSNWSKISITCRNSEMAHFFRPETLRWLKIRTETEFEILIASN